MRHFCRTTLGIAIAISAAVVFESGLFAQGTPTTPEEFADRFMAAMNTKDSDALKKMHHAGCIDSPMKQMIDQLLEAESNSGEKFTKFEILPVPKDLNSQHEGPDGKIYKFNLPVTNMVKISAVNKDNSMSSTVPIGMDDGKYYLVDPEPVKDSQPSKDPAQVKVSEPR